MFIFSFNKIEDVSNGRENIYCGNFKSFSWLSDTNAILVTFFTNPVVVYHGFRAKYEAVQRVDGKSSIEKIVTLFLKSRQVSIKVETNYSLRCYRKQTFKFKFCKSVFFFSRSN